MYRTNQPRMHNNNDNSSNRFLADYEARSSLLRFNEHVNVRELSSYYSIPGKPKNKGKKFNYRVIVILLKNQRMNKVPVPNRTE